MSKELIEKFQYSFAGQHENHALPLPLKVSLQLISEFFENNKNNKLCLVFPSKVHSAQWLSIPSVLFLILSDFSQFKNEIITALERYKPGDKLIINNEAVVEWVGKTCEGYIFKHKEHKGIDSISILLKNLSIIQPARTNRTALSSYSRVMESINKHNSNPTDKLLNIKTQGNRLFQKNSICLISKFKSYDDSIADVHMNQAGINNYFKHGRIDENGKVSESSPLLVTNNFSNLLLYLAESTPVSKIIIDGFTAVTPRSDFSEIDRDFNIPTILITDLSEIDTYEDIKNQGFEFFNFTKENLTIHENGFGSPFESFERKLKRYVSFRLIKEVCSNPELESISQKLHSLTKDLSDENLNTIKVSLIQLGNLLSRICYTPSEIEISNFKDKILRIESNFMKCRLWIGESSKPIEEVIILFKEFVDQLSVIKTEKCIRIEELLQENYDYIICPSEDEASTFRNHLKNHSTKIISVGDLNDNMLSDKEVKAILTGWPKSGNFNRLLSSFLFSEITVLFYQFENKYFTSLQKRNRKNSENIKPTVSSRGIRSATHEATPKGFDDLFSEPESVENPTDSSFDVVEFELKLDNAQYFKFSGKGNIAESCKAKRIDFDNNSFIYASESHKFLVINELIDSVKSNPNIHRKKIEVLQTGDVIAFINTDRDVLIELVEKITKPNELASVKKWTELWKILLRNYFVLIDYDFKKLVEELKKYNCTKHPVTIKTWLQDDNRIGPEDDEDLISIALLTQSNELYENISTVRKAISQMISWRMKASDLVREKIKTKLLTIAKQPIINTSIEIPDLGRVEILKVIELKKDTEEIDKKFVHHLISKETI